MEMTRLSICLVHKNVVVILNEVTQGSTVQYPE